MDDSQDSSRPQRTSAPNEPLASHSGNDTEGPPVDARIEKLTDWADEFFSGSIY